MDQFTFIIYLLICGGSLSIAFYFVRAVILKKQTIDLQNKCDELTVIYKKTQLKINQMSHEYGAPEGIMETGLSGMGIDGIIDSLGLPAIVKPIAKGFINQILNDPDKVKAILNKVGVKIETPEDENKFVGQM